jgi:hypothetical protein
LLELNTIDSTLAYDHLCDAWACKTPTDDNCTILNTHVAFFHQTVFEFLNDPAVWQLECLSSADFNTDPLLACCALCAMQLTSAPPQALNNVWQLRLADMFLHISYFNPDAMQQWRPVFSQLEKYFSKVAVLSASWIPTDYGPAPA